MQRFRAEKYNGRANAVGESGAGRRQTVEA
jgi:hypothetical protein